MNTCLNARLVIELIVVSSLLALSCGGSGSPAAGPTSPSPPTTAAGGACQAAPPSVALPPPRMEVGPAIAEPNTFGKTTVVWPARLNFDVYSCPSNPVTYTARVSTPVVWIIAKSPSRIVLPLLPLTLRQTNESEVMQKQPGVSDRDHCDLMTRIEEDLRRTAIVPKTVRNMRNGGWYRVEMVDSHEDWHVRNHLETVGRIYREFTDRLALLTAASPTQLEVDRDALERTYLLGQGSLLDQWFRLDEQPSHAPNPELFTQAELRAAEAIFAAIATKRAELRCSGVVYRYTGNRFNAFSCEPLPGGGTQACATPRPGQSSYTTSDFVSITLTLQGRLPPNLQRVPICLALSEPCRYDLIASDRHQTLNVSNNSSAAISISTNAQGNIVAPWQILITGSAASQNSIATLINDVGSDLDGGGLRQNDFGRIVGRPGTWTISP